MNANNCELPMTRINIAILAYAASILFIAQALPAQTRGGLALSFGFTESERPVISASYFHRVTPLKIYAMAGWSFFHPGSKVAEPQDPFTHFASVTQIHGGIQIGEVLFISPRLSYNWYGSYRSMGWGLSGGFSLRVSPKVSLGLVASHDRLRFDNAVDAYGPSPFTSVSIVGRFWFVR